MRSQKNKNPKDSREARRWYRMDLHVHTPASADFRETSVTYLDLLKKADEKGLDIFGFADHNTAAGYARYMDEVESLELLERLNRLTPDEKKNLAEFRRLREKLLILPGFEFTATLGFHILCFFPPETSVRRLEHLLLTLRVPPDRLDEGSTECGATSDVLTVYRVVNEAGGLVIAAHANSSHGVAMPGFDFGGQTRIAYTQDPHLHALEVTDFASKSRRRTQLFFSGTKPEYPRRMHILQSSDSHRLTGIPNNNQELGVGDRATEIYLEELSFDAIKDVFLGNDFARTRPYIPTAKHAYDPIYSAREEGETLVQTFHEHLLKGKTTNRAILEDMVALANTNGGTIYIGVSANVRVPPVGVDRPQEAIQRLRIEIQRLIVPPLEVQIDAQKTETKNALRVIVPRGSEVPYALDGSYIYIRQENETNLAVRDEIIQLVRESLSVELAALAPDQERPFPETEEREPEPALIPLPVELEEAGPVLTVPPPRTGVELVASENRKGTMYYTIRDLRNNRAVHNITRSSARKLWQYAISEFEDHPVDPALVKWQGSIGLVKSHKRAGKMRYDLAERTGEGRYSIYYGVTEDGIHGLWRTLLGPETGSEEGAPVISDLDTGGTWGPNAGRAEAEESELEGGEYTLDAFTAAEMGFSEEEPGAQAELIPEPEEMEEEEGIEEQNELVAAANMEAAEEVLEARELAAAEAALPLEFTPGAEMVPPTPEALTAEQDESPIRVEYLRVEPTPEGETGEPPEIRNAEEQATLMATELGLLGTPAEADQVASEAGAVPTALAHLGETEQDELPPEVHVVPGLDEIMLQEDESRPEGEAEEEEHSRAAFAPASDQLPIDQEPGAGAEPGASAGRPADPPHYAAVFPGLSRFTNAANADTPSPRVFPEKRGTGEPEASQPDSPPEPADEADRNNRGPEQA